MLGSDTYHDATRRVTWVTEVDFGETEQQRRYRAHLNNAADVVKRGMSARSVAESSRFEEGSLVETARTRTPSDWASRRAASCARRPTA